MTRSFAVHATRPHSPARVVSEASFEAAAAAFLEDYAPPADHEGDISLIVRDMESGGEHCFRIDLDTGDAAPCG